MFIPIGKSLAKAFVHDRLCLNVVNGSDPVPRMSHHHLRQLGQELIDFTHQANVYMEEDKADLSAYVGWCRVLCYVNVSIHPTSNLASMGCT
ncbi:hypothetical protein EON65_19265 [archaeon]|nr:MAG: hypothetical protein EON65_19265 [archaeon]